MTIEATLISIDNSLKALLALQQGKSPAPAAAKGKTETTPASAEPKGLTYDDVKVPFLDLVKNKGREAGVTLLKKFGAEKLPDVKPADFQKCLDAIKEAAKVESALA